MFVSIRHSERLDVANTRELPRVANIADFLLELADFNPV